MKELEKNRASENDRQLAFCFDSSELREQPCAALPNVIDSLAVLPLGPSKVIAFPTKKRSSVEATLLARILQRTRLFK
ncbi:hypothetical protein [Pseudomonas aeruginosa]|uniref:hypothetical protein n=1 Tax=Pseudomonas aeruginosa TaxID=287 RepID=UPI000F52F9FD|nr:hypothetical protein [Pseudomonas aeruginosa]MBA4958764.1 hypothetical protein [Pseudomonas aeruginosa]MEA0989773.1 hypothetical protein [Pseudomonas aeruginosa]RUB86113.1 hypothetical protein IPC1417_16945 [Pseudomonas aeruginosa]RUH65909.1 hypothetical protein IPC450_14025 [Pseudomonas aeruginosa]RUH76486.1 hypothetical protein IPC445_17925 [Pseudomonas aeruginosa]